MFLLTVSEIFNGECDAMVDIIIIIIIIIKQENDYSDVRQL